jgi:hypothetical protein
LLNMHLCLALHLFDEMPDRPSSRLFLVLAMPHALTIVASRRHLVLPTFESCLSL